MRFLKDRSGNLQVAYSRRRREQPIALPRDQSG